ncbi:MAG: N-acetyltransferase [Burkholderiales bacterium]|nr:N-acetyltransferase [Burkholderiales bacterium]
MNLIHCTEARHAGAILDILNEAIVNSTAVYDYAPRPPSAMAPWFATKRSQGWPVLGLEAADGTLASFASYGSFRAWPAYKYTVEHSIYVHHAHRGQGLGRRLLAALVDEAQRQGLHTMVGGIDRDNAGSIALHRSLGFEPAGVIRQAGFKFGRWLDLAFYQRVLATPAQPVDG